MHRGHYGVELLAYQSVPNHWRIGPYCSLYCVGGTALKNVTQGNSPRRGHGWLFGN